MNAKKAKQLRNIAEEATVGQPYVKYLRHKSTGQVVIDPRTTKGYYRQLKKQAA